MDDRVFEENIARILQDDKEGLRAIYEEYRVMIYTAVYEILGSRENSEDLASDFFIRLWEAAESYRPGNGHRAWMLTIARNMAKDFLRKHSREQLVDEFPETAAESGDVYQETENLIAYEQMVSGLPPEEREILNLKILGELTFREIAEQTGKPQGTVSWIYRKALQHVREGLQRMKEGPKRAAGPPGRGAVVSQNNRKGGQQHE